MLVLFVRTLFVLFMRCLFVVFMRSLFCYEEVVCLCL